MKRKMNMNKDTKNKMIIAVRIRGEVKVSHKIESTMQMLGLKRRNMVSLLPNNDSTLGMIRRVEDFVTWGEVSDDIVSKLKQKSKDKESKIFNLAPAKKSLKNVRKRYPKGDLGYRGKEINKLIERMI